MKTLTILFALFISLGAVYCQINPPKKNGFFSKLSKSDTVPGWFRFAKHAHGLSIRPSVAILIQNGNTKDSSNFGVNPALTVGYEFFLLRRFSLGTANKFSWGFNKNPKLNDFGLNKFSLTARFYFFGNNKGFICSTFEFANSRQWGYSNVSSSNNLPNVLAGGVWYLRKSNYLGPGVFFGLYIFNNMSCVIGNQWLYKIDGNFSRQQHSFAINFTYYFRKNQLPHSKKPIKDWFKSDRPKRTHAERREQERKAKAGY